jgi:glycosyltransferase involved in cell wall biosynthesis
MEKLVSICIPTYNGGKYLQEALNSVKSQAYKNVEVIISDDNSKDETLAICQKFKEESDFPVYIYHHIPDGIGSNWNYCVEKSNGEYIKFLFQDDILFPNCLSEMVDILVKKTQIAMVVSKRKLIYTENYLTDELKTWIDMYGDLQRSLNLVFDKMGICIINNRIFKRDVFFSNPLNKIGEPVTVLLRRNVFDKTGFFNTELKQILDFEYWYRVLKTESIAIMNYPLVGFRLHEEQATAKNNNVNVNEFSNYKAFVEKELFSLLNFKMRMKIIIRKIKDKIL